MSQLRIMLILGVGLAVIWSGYWVYATQKNATRIERLLSPKSDAHWRFVADNYKQRGFPNRVDASFEAPRLEAWDRALVWSGPFLQDFRLSYRLGHSMLIFPPSQSLAVFGDLYEIASESTRASVVRVTDQAKRIVLESEKLSLRGGNVALEIEHIEAAFLIEADKIRFRLILRHSTKDEAIAAPLLVAEGHIASLDERPLSIMENAPFALQLSSLQINGKAALKRSTFEIGPKTPLRGSLKLAPETVDLVKGNKILTALLNFAELKLDMNELRIIEIQP